MRSLSSVLFCGLLALIALPAPAQPPAVPDAEAAAESPTAATDGAGPGLEALARFAQVYHLVKSAYVDTVDDAELIELAIAGMLAGLDDHSAWLDADTLTVLTDDTLGAYDGLGVEVLSGDGVIQVLSAMPDSPADRAGLRAGDFITHIDGERIGRGNLEASLRKLRGRPGTRIRLTVERDGEDDARELELLRARIRLSSVSADLAAPGWGHVRVSMVQAQTVPELGRRLRGLEREGGPLKGLVLDLRGNPGGALDAAVAIADLFLAEGRIVAMDGRLDGTRRSYDARPGSPWETLPVVVLIDRGSASAAEIIAAALQDNGRAKVLGERSYGKGSVQNVFALDPDHAVRLTTARYYTPAGRSIQDEGVIPDRLVADSDDGAGGDPVLRQALELLAATKLQESPPESPPTVDRKSVD